MTPQEQELITELFARLKQTPAQAKDADADRLVRKGLIETPDAPYLLVQTVLIQDMALSQAQQRIAELENHLAEAKAAPSPQATSFLGGALTRGSAAPTGPWGRAPAPEQPAPQPAAAPGPSPSAANPAPFESAPAGGMMASASSGFLRAAAATAVGVVGGQLLFQGIQSMFGHHSGSILSGQTAQPALSETVVNNYYGDKASSQASAGGATADASSDNAAAKDKSDDLSVADDDLSQDSSNQDMDAANIASDDNFDASDTDLT